MIAVRAYKLYENRLSFIPFNSELCNEIVRALIDTVPLAMMLPLWDLNVFSVVNFIEAP